MWREVESGHVEQGDASFSFHFTISALRVDSIGVLTLIEIVPLLDKISKQLAKDPDGPVRRAIMHQTVIKGSVVRQGGGYVVSCGAGKWRELLFTLLHYWKRAYASCVTALSVGLEVCDYRGVDRGSNYDCERQKKINGDEPVR